MSQRKARVEHALRDVLTSAIAADIKDPRVRAATLITVTKVEMNVDMAVANVYVSIIGDDATIDAALLGLQKAASFLRGPVAREIQLQRAPELRFKLDEGLDISQKLEQIVREDAARARAAGREIDGPTPSPATTARPPRPAPSATTDEEAAAVPREPESDKGAS